MAYHKAPTCYDTEQWFEVLYANSNDCADWNESYDLVQGFDDEYQPGWYFAFGEPGCLWDSEPFGPYPTELEAIEAAEEMVR
jgi:hypothetical protein